MILCLVKGKERKGKKKKKKKKQFCCQEIASHLYFGGWVGCMGKAI
jgi:hypothetical protein